MMLLRPSASASMKLTKNADGILLVVTLDAFVPAADPPIGKDPLGEALARIDAEFRKLKESLGVVSPREAPHHGHP